MSILEFDIAKDMLHSSRNNLEIDPLAVEDICLSCSQEFYDNANSGNYHFGDMKLAYEWYAKHWSVINLAINPVWFTA